MVWKFTSDRPVYQQIMDHIRSAVISGELAPGDRIASVRTLAAEARVNPNTMQHALQELEREGLLINLGTTGREITQDQAVIEGSRQAMIRQLVHQSVQAFSALGIEAAQAARLLEGIDSDQKG